MSVEAPENTKTVVFPTHLDLPCKDDKPVDNVSQPLQASLLTSSIEPLLQERHPDSDYLVASNCGIYWKATNPPLDGCKAPDWYFVPGVPKELDGEMRRSFVMWAEGTAPLIVMEFVSGTGAEELDTTPGKGKFWVYQNGIRAPYYVIHDALRETLSVYRKSPENYRPMEPNKQGRYEIPEMGIALGHWHGEYARHESCWLRFFTLDGKMLPTAEERAVKAEAELAALKAKLAAKGIDPKTL
jgi:Uma2 family endonuclease